MAIGKLVKAYTGDIFAYCDFEDHAEIDRLLDREYSKRTFGLSFPFCKQVKDIEPTESKRFRTDVYMVRGKQVRVISQWTEKHHLAFISYLVEHGIATEADALEREALWSGAGQNSSSAVSTPVVRTSTRVNARYRSYAIGIAQNAFIRNILGNLGEESFGERDWVETKAHFQNRCAYCGQDGDLVIEHAIPINRDRLGEHRLGNLIPSCRQCNADKGSKDYREFLEGSDEAIAQIEAYMDSRNYVPLEDSEQMKMILNMAHGEVAALADRYAKLINSLFGQGEQALNEAMGAEITTDDEQPVDELS